MADQPRGVLWDLDGTLVDTAQQHFASSVDVFGPRGVTLSPELFLRTFGRRNIDVLRDLLGDHLSDDEALQISAAKEQRYRQLVLAGDLMTLPGVDQWLTRLERQVGGKRSPRRRHTPISRPFSTSSICTPRSMPSSVTRTFNAASPTRRFSASPRPGLESHRNERSSLRMRRPASKPLVEPACEALAWLAAILWCIWTPISSSGHWQIYRLTRSSILEQPPASQGLDSGR